MLSYTLNASRPDDPDEVVGYTSVAGLLSSSASNLTNRPKKHIS